MTQANFDPNQFDQLILQRLPALMRQNKQIQELVLELARENFAERQDTEDKFYQILNELKRDREVQARKWDEQNRKWDEYTQEQNRKWEAYTQEQNRKWDEQNRKWEEFKEYTQEQNRKWDEQNRKWDEFKEYTQEQNRKWDEQNRKWDEFKEYTQEQNRKWDEQNRKWEEFKEYTQEQNRKWDEQNRKWDEFKEYTQEQNRKWDEFKEYSKEQNHKWDEQNRKWDEFKEYSKEQNHKWDEQNRKWDEAKQEFQQMHEAIMAIAQKQDRSLGALGARWGIQSENSFRKALAAILEKSFGVEVLNVNEYDDEGVVFGRPDQIELDVIIKNGLLIICEIKSSISKTEMHIFERKVRFYEKRHQRPVTRMLVISPMVDARAHPLAESLGIEVYTDSVDVKSL